MSPLDGTVALYTAPAETRSLYDRAADEIERRGWCQGLTMNAAGAVCIVGALARVLHTDLPPVLIGRLGFGEASHSREWKRVVRWNDAPERTAAEVIARLRAAGRAERAA